MRMMWMGLVSAWGALAMAAVLGASAAVQFAEGVPAWIHAGAALLLAIGGFRTLRKMSGGLRLLAGAWGLSAGLLLLPLTVAQGTPAMWSRISAGEFVFIAAALAGLVLTVLHQERR
jgi:hypothetical protein